MGNQHDRALSLHISPDTVIRPAQESDLGALRVLQQSCFAPDFWDDDDDILRMLRVDTCLVAQRDGQVVGAALAQVRDDAFHVYRVEVNPWHQKLGLGTRLLQVVVDQATKDRITAHAISAGGRALCRRLGFLERTQTPRGVMERSKVQPTAECFPEATTLALTDAAALGSDGAVAALDGLRRTPPAGLTIDRCRAWCAGYDRILERKPRNLDGYPDDRRATGLIPPEALGISAHELDEHPDDRFYCAEERTWWRRGASGFVSSFAPPGWVYTDSALGVSAHDPRCATSRGSSLASKASAGAPLPIDPEAMAAPRGLVTELDAALGHEGSIAALEGHPPTPPERLTDDGRRAWLTGYERIARSQDLGAARAALVGVLRGRLFQQLPPLLTELREVAGGAAEIAQLSRHDPLEGT